MLSDDDEMQDGGIMEITEHKSKLFDEQMIVDESKQIYDSNPKDVTKSTQFESVEAPKEEDSSLNSQADSPMKIDNSTVNNESPFKLKQLIKMDEIAMRRKIKLNDNCWRCIGEFLTYLEHL